MKDISTSQLERQEKDAFLDWRRGLAECVPSGYIVYFLREYLPETTFSRHVLDFKNKTTSSSHHSNGILKFGDNYGVSWNVPISLYRLSIRETHYALDAKIWSLM